MNNTFHMYTCSKHTHKHSHSHSHLYIVRAHHVHIKYKYKYSTTALAFATAAAYSTVQASILCSFTSSTFSYVIPCETIAARLLFCFQSSLTILLLSYYFSPQSLSLLFPRIRFLAAGTFYCM